MVGITIIVTVITAAGRESLLTVGALLILVVLCITLPAMPLDIIAWKLFKMPEQDRRTHCL